ncbi:inosine-5'-monophosphate dehydrogenase [Ferroacidibacillus organovorans]|uniref:Inosine-5'-monophosphate dehydrogenase n=2 Tax=Ferroacidibacillus organovorans TaxID=1765683 RepID=A0A853KAR8_9BACL|nr:CBS domain-containing protein [Ferroacidibacillus organovorans]OAG94116.1 inosine-5'-monophosphate dehydrogenase [Ferroacidibacillus organovorans]
MRMKVRDLMTSHVVTCATNATCEDAAKKMRTEKVGSIPVVEGSKLVGIITDRDIVVECVAQGKSCSETQVATIMTKNPVTCTPETDAHEAARMMAREQIRRLPVIENGTLCGVCALGDLAVVDIHVNEAGEALSGISEQTQIH